MFPQEKLLPSCGFFLIKNCRVYRWLVVFTQGILKEAVVSCNYSIPGCPFWYLRGYYPLSFPLMLQVIANYMVKRIILLYAGSW